MPGILIAQQDTSGGSAGAGVIIGLLFLGMFIAMFAGIWKTYVKAGQPGWAALIPIYNVVVLLRIVRRPTWWAVLFFIPPIAVVFAVITAIDLAEAFGKGAGFGVGLTFLPAFFYPALGFGDARYNGVAWSGAPAAATA